MGLASHQRQDNRDIITFDTEAIPSEYVGEGTVHKLRRYRGMLGRASFVLGQVASRLEQVIAAFNWTDGHLTLLVYGLLGGVAGAMTLLFYFVPVGVVVMVLGMGYMLDGFISALQRWEQDQSDTHKHLPPRITHPLSSTAPFGSHLLSLPCCSCSYTLEKMKAMLLQIEQLSDQRTGRRKPPVDPNQPPPALLPPKAVTPEPTPDPTPHSLTLPDPSHAPPPIPIPEPLPAGRNSAGATPTSRASIAPQLATVYTSITGVDAHAKREEMKRAADTHHAPTPRHSFFNGLRRRAKPLPTKAKAEQLIITSFDDAALSIPQLNDTPPTRPRTSSADSLRPEAPLLVGESPEAGEGLTPGFSPSGTPQAAGGDSPVSSGRLTASALKNSSSWPGSLADARQSAEGDGEEEDGEGEEAADLSSVVTAHPWAAFLPSRASLLYYAVALYSLLPLLHELLSLVLLYLKASVRHLASRAPDSLEVAHRVISERAMKDHSVIDDNNTVKRRSNQREQLKRRKAQLAPPPIHTPALPTGQPHSALGGQLAHVLSSWKAKIHGLHPHVAAGSASVSAAAAEAAAAAAAAASGSRVREVGGARLSVESVVAVAVDAVECRGGVGEGRGQRHGGCGRRQRRRLRLQQRRRRPVRGSWRRLRVHAAGRTAAAVAGE